MQVMILSQDKDRNRMSLSTKKLEPTPGDMLKDPQLVYDQAEEMAEAFRRRLAEAEAAAKTEGINFPDMQGYDQGGYGGYDQSAQGYNQGAFGSGYDPQQSYDAQQSYDPQQSHDPQQSYDPPQSFDSQQSYDDSEDFPPEQSRRGRY